ncbi:hypothetical protein HanLR1_Chr05g0176391 [Helianthus annuus]|nr:hypothetical protein HanLR1_Chr05g0176391 [Helianthus annuus]
MKGETLLMLHKHEEVIQMCEQTLTSAKKNFVTIDDIDHMQNEDQVRPLKLSRWSLMARWLSLTWPFLSLRNMSNWHLLKPKLKAHLVFHVPLSVNFFGVRCERVICGFGLSSSYLFEIFDIVDFQLTYDFSCYMHILFNVLG